MKICFVCYGNICRSPMAEYILKQKLREIGKDGDFVVESRAISDEEYGHDIYPPIKDVMDKQHILYDKHKATPLKASDYSKFDKFICMDDSNVRDINYIFDNTSKVSKLLDRDISDPWFTRDFNQAYQDISEGIDKLMKEIS